MATSTTLKKLENIAKKLMQQAQAIDDNKQHNKNALSEKTLFSPPLFITKSERYLPYTEEVQANINQVSRLIVHSEHADFIYQALHKIEQQIAALTTAFKANHRYQQIEHQLTQAKKKQYYQKAAQAMLQTTHHLYQQLAETHEFERRLMEMLELKQIALNQATARTQAQLSQEVLTLHQRLGRCRQAISKIERQIEMSEKR